MGEEKGKIRTFRDLIAWQRAMELARVICGTTRHMPESERPGLTNQMRRAAVSAASNIAEGYARQSRSEYIRFLRAARGSLAELSTQHELAIDLEMLVPNDAASRLLAETDRVFQGLIRGLQNLS